MSRKRYISCRPCVRQVRSDMPELRLVQVESIKIPDVRVSSVLNEEQKALLSSTIKEVGVVQDIVVRQLSSNEYELVAGKSRLNELEQQGLKEVQVKVIQADEKLGLMMNIIENVARGTYEYVSISRAIRKLRALGASHEDLEKVFPWKARWIQFIEEIQDLPDDVVQAVSERKLTPTHVQVALNLPTPEEVHSGLQTAMRLSWDTGTFKTFVENRIGEIEAARREAMESGLKAEIPPPNPEQLVSYKLCLLCGYRKPAEKVPLKFVCEGCSNLVRYLTSQLGTPEETLTTVYNALQFYYGKPVAQEELPPPPSEGSSQE